MACTNSFCCKAVVDTLTVLADAYAVIDAIAIEFNAFGDSS